MLDHLNPYSLGYRINILRRALSWTQDQADRMLHAGKGVVRQHEAGRRRWPRLILLRRLHYLEGIYAEEIRTYLAIADTDKRKRIHFRDAPICRPPDLQEALGRVGTVGITGSSAQARCVPPVVSGIRAPEERTPPCAGHASAAWSGHAGGAKESIR